jgi:hypothetical protein
VGRSFADAVVHVLLECARIVVRVQLCRIFSLQACARAISVGRSRFSGYLWKQAVSLWRQDFIYQTVVRCFKRIDESDSRQFKAVLQVLGEQMTNAGPLCRSPQHRIPERQPVFFHRIERR